MCIQSLGSDDGEAVFRSVAGRGGAAMVGLLSGIFRGCFCSLVSVRGLKVPPSSICVL